MRETTVARNYAETLFELAARHDAQVEYGELMEELTGLLDEMPELRRLLETPQVEDEEKKELLRRVFGDRVPGPFLRFLLVTIDKRRQRLLAEIGSAYHELLDEHLGRAHVEVTLAREPDEERREELDRTLSRILGRTAVTRVRVKPEILGGMILRTGDRIFDGSIRRRLELLRRRLIGRKDGRGSTAAGRLRDRAG